MALLDLKDQFPSSLFGVPYKGKWDGVIIRAEVFLRKDGKLLVKKIGRGALRAAGFLLTGVTFEEDLVRVGSSTFEDSTWSPCTPPKGASSVMESLCSSPE